MLTPDVASEPFHHYRLIQDDVLNTRTGTLRRTCDDRIATDPRSTTDHLFNWACTVGMGFLLPRRNPARVANRSWATE